MKNIVTIGGGTGGFTILSGLKTLPDITISAIVSMADDGVSTGMLRDELGVLPPGDVRKCLVALSEHSTIMRELMNYRFEEGKLSGHTVGNIFLAALEKITGSFVEGVEIASEILKVKGTVIPVTKNQAKLNVLSEDGLLFEGESKVDRANLQTSTIQKIFYKEDVQLNPHAEKAIMQADFIIFGPGDLYTSVIPNIIVSGFREALIKSEAKIIFPINLTNKKGHTMRWKISDYVKTLEFYLGKSLDFILINNELPSPDQILRYKLEEGDGVIIEDDFKDPRIVHAPLLSKLIIENDKADIEEDDRSFIRHDSRKLTDSIHSIILSI